jgi:hypothetical protein
VYSDNIFSLISLGVVFLLRQDKNYFTIAGHIFIPVLFFTITYAFFLSGDDASKDPYFKHAKSKLMSTLELLADRLEARVSR